MIMVVVSIAFSYWFCLFICSLYVYLVSSFDGLSLDSPGWPKTCLALASPCDVIGMRPANSYVFSPLNVQSENIAM